MDRLLWRTIIVAICPCCALVCLPVSASTVTVPDDYPTVQGAIDSGADTVQVRSGRYEERPVVDRGVVLQSLGPERPLLDGLEIFNLNFLSTPRQLGVQGLHFAGRVNHTTNAVHPRNLSFTFSECSLDSGFNQLFSLDQNDIETLVFRNCHLIGRTEARAVFITMEADTIDGNVAWTTDGDVLIRGCTFRGDTLSTAIELFNVPGGVIATNRIANYMVGMSGHNMRPCSIIDNVITNCALGIRVTADEPVEVIDNLVIGCGMGMYLAPGRTFTLRRNTVLEALGTGIQAGLAGVTVEENVVGDCGGAGMIIEVVDEPILRRNTLYSNGGAGMEVRRVESGQLLVENNISYENRTWGLSVDGTAAPVLSCNDWFGNVQGAVSVGTIGSSDVMLDPMFCNLDSADVRLQRTSPLMNIDDCGQIGAKGVGCGATETVLARFDVEEIGTSARVRWRFGSSQRVESWVERGPSDRGPWGPLPGRPEVNGQEFVQTDEKVEPGHTYWYRVGWRHQREVTYSSSHSLSLASGRAPSRILPNPSGGAVAIEWSQAVPGDVDIRVYDLAGREVIALVHGRFESGRHGVHWDGRRAGLGPLAPGWYVVRLEGAINARHMLLCLR